MFAVWVADQELASIKRRTRDGLERARRQGKSWDGRHPPAPADGCDAPDATGGASYRLIAEAFQSSASTVRRVLQQVQ